jgi:DNA-binding ferritin-like protein
MNETPNVAMFAATLLHSATNTHFFHWSTNSYSQHKALQKYYQSVQDLVDDYVEAFSGCYEQIKEFPSVYHQPKDALKYLESLKNFVAEANSDLPQKQELINIVAEIQQLIDSTIYKLKYLK